MKLLYLTLVMTLIAITGSKTYAAGGPDAYGYTWTTSLDAGGPAYNWIDITSRPGVQTVSGLADDNSAAAMINMGFPFHYYWNDYTQLKIGSNGWLSFNNVSNIASCFPIIPNAGGAADNYLAPLMGDLNFTGAGNPGQVKYWSNNIDSLVISYIDVPFWTVSAPGWTGSNNFQVILSAADSSITFQYGALSGFQNNAACIDMTVGIENSTGAIGLQVHSDALPPTNYAIKFDYPAVVLLSIIDPMAHWNTNSDNKALILPQAAPHALTANYRNAGNTNVTAAIDIYGTVFDAASTTVHSTYGTLPSLAAGDDTTIVYSNAWTPAATGQYTFRSELTNAQDINTGNNSNDAELDIVDVCSANMTLSYVSGNIPAATISWNGGANDDGVAVYFAPPVYPYTVSSLQFYITSNISNGYIAQIYDDNGPNGTQGTLLYSQTVPNTSVIGGAWNTVPVATPVTLNDGGFYVAWIQGGTTIYLGAETIGPFSRRNSEILDAGWADYRENASRDACIRATIGNYPSTPTAAFSSVANQADVQFTDLTAGPALTSWYWDFGDGNASTDQHLVHTFAGAGTYNVCVTVGNPCGNNQSCQSIEVCETPVADVAATPSGLSVDFTDLSTGTTSGWQWDFGDGNTSTAQDPTHVYANDGMYSVCLIVTNNCGEADTTCTTVTVCGTMTAAYTYTIDDMIIHLTDQTSGTPVSWNWDFGDGFTITGQDPSHVYSDPGVYLVCLTATNACGESVTTCSSVTICSAPVASFAASPNELDVDFSDLSSGTVNAWQWNFGDGYSSTNQNPSHTYATEGEYVVCLIASNTCGNVDTLCQNVTICTSPTAVFSSMINSLDGLGWAFTDQSIGTVVSWQWTFGDGNQSTDQNPEHFYSTEGTYTVCLIVTRDCGASDTLCQQITVDMSGLEENSQLVLNAYPNPTQDQLVLVFTTEVQDAVLEITDLAGKVVQTETLSGKTAQVDVRGLAAGYYKARVLHAGGTAVLTLLKQ